MKKLWISLVLAATMLTASPAVSAAEDPAVQPAAETAEELTAQTALETAAQTVAEDLSVPADTDEDTAAEEAASGDDTAEIGDIAGENDAAEAGITVTENDAAETGIAITESDAAEAIVSPAAPETAAENAEDEEILLQDPDEEQAKPFSVSYTTHVQTYGWLDPVSDGKESGTTGESKRLEGIRISLENSPYEGSVRYCTHVQTYGWQDWRTDGAMAGTEGEAKRLEAIQISLTGELADHYDIWYQTHVQHFGWSGWAVNGESCGSAGYAYRLEAIRIQLVPKGEKAPGSTAGIFHEKDSAPVNGISAYAGTQIRYTTHVQTYGWQDWRTDGATAGTSGESKRLEGIRIALTDVPSGGGVRYRTHIQGIGWQDYVSDGSLSGTTGQARRLEAIQIELTGTAAEAYDIYYRVHSQTYGWLPWARNGQQTGTSGMSKRLEAIEIRLMPKGTEVPQYNENASVMKVNTVKKHMFLGDSRTCCIVNATHGTALWRNGATTVAWYGNDFFACKWGGHLTEGNNYFVNSVIAAMEDNTNVYVLMGRNDIGIPQTQYAGMYNTVLAQLAAAAAQKENSRVYFVTCGPDQGYPVTQFAEFNAAVNCDGVQKLDPWTSLGDLTYTTNIFGDFHYSTETSIAWYDWLKAVTMH